MGSNLVDGTPLTSLVWALHGIWDPKTNAALKPTYFATLASDPSKKADFVPDFWGPHFVDYITRIRKVHRDAICFVEPPVFHKPPRLPETILAGRACYAPHFYDGLTLMTKHWNWFNADALGLIRGKYWTVLQAVKVGDAAIKQMLQDALSVFLQDTKECMGEYPTLLGEIGCPYDMVSRSLRCRSQLPVANINRTTRRLTATWMAGGARVITRCNGGHGTHP